MRTKITIGTILISLLVVAVIVLGIVIGNQNKGFNQQIEDLKTEKILTEEDYQVGGINTATGKFDTENEFALMTMNYYKLDGAKIEFDSGDTTISYRVFYYNANKEFVGNSDFLKVDYNLTAPEGSVYFRIMVNTDEIKPTDKNVSDLLVPITVTVKK